MRIVVVCHCYSQLLSWLYEKDPALAQQSFAAQRSAYYDTLFGTSDFYVRALQDLGHDAEEFVYNNVRAQFAWLHENPGSFGAHCPEESDVDRAAWMRSWRGGAKGWRFNDLRQVQIVRERLETIPLTHIKQL